MTTKITKQDGRLMFPSAFVLFFVFLVLNKERCATVGVSARRRARNQEAVEAPRLSDGEVAARLGLNRSVVPDQNVVRPPAVPALRRLGFLKSSKTEAQRHGDRLLEMSPLIVTLCKVSPPLCTRDRRCLTDPPPLVQVGFSLAPGAPSGLDRMAPLPHSQVRVYGHGEGAPCRVCHYCAPSSRSKVQAHRKRLRRAAPPTRNRLRQGTRAGGRSERLLCRGGSAAARDVFSSCAIRNSFRSPLEHRRLTRSR